MAYMLIEENSGVTSRILLAGQFLPMTTPQWKDSVPGQWKVVDPIPPLQAMP